MSNLICANTKEVFTVLTSHLKANVFFSRMDGVLKHLSESRDIEHRLRALENEVKSQLQHFCGDLDMY